MTMKHGMIKIGAGLQSSECCTEDRRRTLHATWHACSGWDLSVLAARTAIQATSTPTPSRKHVLEKRILGIPCFFFWKSRGCKQYSGNVRPKPPICNKFCTRPRNATHSAKPLPAFSGPARAISLIAHRARNRPAGAMRERDRADASEVY